MERNRHTSMNINSDISNVRQRVVAFVTCDDAITFGRMVNLTAFEERRLDNALAALRNYRLILTASVEPVKHGYGFEEVAAHLRACIGAPIADAALAAAERSVPSLISCPSRLRRCASKMTILQCRCHRCERGSRAGAPRTRRELCGIRSGGARLISVAKGRGRCRPSGRHRPVFFGDWGSDTWSRPNRSVPQT
jgi:hypothetical protein